MTSPLAAAYTDGPRTIRIMCNDGHKRVQLVDFVYTAPGMFSTDEPLRKPTESEPTLQPMTGNEPFIQGRGQITRHRTAIRCAKCDRLLAVRDIHQVLGPIAASMPPGVFHLQLERLAELAAKVR